MLKRGAALPAWIVYGMASSGYLLMIPSIGYATYYRSHVAAGRPDADALWAVTVAGALLIAGCLGPFLGAYADRFGLRRRLMTALTGTSVVLVAPLVFVLKGDVISGALLFVGAHASFLLAKALYDSYLPQLGGDASLSQISGVGWGLGYVGSIACFLLCLPLIKGGAEQADPLAFRMAFVVTAAFFGLIALPALIWFPPDRPDTHAADQSGRATFAQVLHTLRHWRDHREVLKFLLAFYLINDAVVTIILFVGIYLQTTFGYSVERILELTLLFYLIGIPATIFFGWLGRAWSERGALYVTLAIWLTLIALLAAGESAAVPVVGACLAGLVIGSTQALCRSIYARMIPSQHASEFFGFNAFVGRASAAIGPLTFGLVSVATGSQRTAMVSLSFFFLAGGCVLAFVRMQSPAPTPALPGARAA